MPTLILLLLTLAACSSDPAPVDSGATDTGALDAPAADVGDDRSAPLDAGPRDVGIDTGAADVGFDVGAEATVQDRPGPDVADAPVTDATRADAPTTDAGVDVPEDARVSCGSLPTEPSCSTSAQCAICQPASTGEVWCCRVNGTCGVSPGVFACP